MPKYAPRILVRLLIGIVKKFMKFNPDYKHDAVLWANLDNWQDYENYKDSKIS